MRKLILIVRFVAAVVAGMLVISLLVEAVEFGLVAAVHGAVTIDPAIYFGVRNSFPVLHLKFLYNVLGGLAGGYLAAWIARRHETRVGLILALIQTTALVAAMLSPQMGVWTPAWVWLTLIATMFPAIVLGALWRHRQLLSKPSVLPAS